MSEKRAKRLRREALARGEAPHEPVYTTPTTFNIKGKEVYIPRRERRKLVRQFLTGVRKGRINLNDRAK